MRKRRFPILTGVLATVFMAACGGGGNGVSDEGDDTNDPPPPPPPPPVVIDIADASAAEGDGSGGELVFEVTLSEAAADDVTVDYATADGSASAASDYTAEAGTLTIPAGDTLATLVVGLIGDTDVEPDETLTVTLSNPSSNAELGDAEATGGIINDDADSQPVGTGLNDTGVTGCSTEIADDLPCGDASAGTDQFPRQDAQFGRDVTAPAPGDGRVGFSFVKLDTSGQPLADQSAAYAASPWDCVRDEVTGLVWEVKTDGAATYSWRNTSGIDDAGDPGEADGGNCPAPGACDTEAYAAAVNAGGLCGRSDWRLPKRSELVSLVDYGVAGGARIDTAFFPNTAAGRYWSAEPNARGDVHSVDFATGESDGADRSDALAVRLVSNGEIQ
ncbi:Lcl domain-containing protein [Lentisalinibacter orientalis]|uniref:Lcl domain-containing protein n=1 Tax=Lentisalinibacter orientalis TaxID=2992241 RepID=UPI00386FAFB0